MTRLAILADIHGNLPALEAVQADLAQFSVEQVIVAGDIINWGPSSAEVATRILEAGWPLIRGNNEFYLLDYGTPRAPAAWADTNQWALLPWLRQQLPAPWPATIAAWPDTLSLRFADAPPIRVLHGSPRANNEPIFATDPDTHIATLLAGVEEQVVVAAHTHLALDRRVNGWHILNPGSAGVPLDGRHLARYLLLEGDERGWRPTFREVPIDPAPVLAAFERQGFLESCGVVGELVIEEYRRARLELLPFVNWRQACRPGQPLSYDLLAEYRRLDPLPYVPKEYRLGWPARP
ncbi:MAG: metallophosphoesterase family protein [Anaerolineales bacterium]